MSTDTYARNLIDPATGLVREDVLPPAGGGRAILRAVSDRADGYVDPSTHGSTFSNVDNSTVLLPVPVGQWMIGWRSYVKSVGGYARMEADVFISPEGAADPFAPSAEYPNDDDYYAAFNVIESSSNADVFLECHMAVEVVAPSQIAASIYTNAGAMVIGYAGFLKLAQLFAWPIG